MVINSYDKELNNCKFEEGKLYWTYYFETNKKRTSIRNYTGIVQVRLKKIWKSQYSSMYYELEFEYVSDISKIGSTMQHNFTTYMNGYGTASCYFSEDRDEICRHHDDEIKKLAKNQNTHDRGVMYKKLIFKEAPKKSTIEIEAEEWYKNLSNKEKSYVQWIKDYYEEI